MTPIEALAHIVQSADLNIAATVNSLARVARVALRESGEHGLLYVEDNRGVRTAYCYCGWVFTETSIGVDVELTIASHAAAMRGET